MTRETSDSEDKFLEMYGIFVKANPNGYEQNHNVPTEKEMEGILELLEVVED